MANPNMKQMSSVSDLYRKNYDSIFRKSEEKQEEQEKESKEETKEDEKDA